MNFLTKEQAEEWSNLEERYQHSDTMKFSSLDYLTMLEYRSLSERLAHENLVNEKWEN